jgi:hypothetical protein
VYIRRFGPNLQNFGCLKARNFSEKVKGPKLWIQVVRRALLAQKGSKTMDTDGKARTFNAKGSKTMDTGS